MRSNQDGLFSLIFYFCLVLNLYFQVDFFTKEAANIEEKIE